MENEGSNDIWTAEMQSDIAGEEWLPQIVVKLHDDVEVASAFQLGEYMTAQVSTGLGLMKSIALVKSLINTTNRAIIPSLLGVIAAIDNDRGCVGVVPNLASIGVVSYSGDNSKDYANAIAVAAYNLKYGDIFVIEANVFDQVRDVLVPVEVLRAAFDMIKMATAAGIIVVEAAGNGSTNLDRYRHFSTQKYILNPDSDQFLESGAILVGAGTSRHPHERFDTSNYGKRVNCFAWGENVTTCISDVVGSTNRYRYDFDHTSAATAIIAGCAASVQGMVEQNLGYRLSPRQMRDLLGNPDIGTPSARDLAAGGAKVDLIGVMPNLEAISRRVLNIRPAPYLRQSIGDDGSLPRETAFTTPDIIMTTVIAPDPQAQFGEGSGTENSDLWSGKPGSEQNAFLYLRARNRGGASAAGALATVFWSQLSTLLTPDHWRLIGSVRFPEIPNGDLLIVSEPLIWPEPEMPDDDTYSLIALLTTPDDPTIIPPQFKTMDDYLSFVADNRNTGVKNLNVVAYDPATSREYPDDKEYIAMSFIAPGPPDTGRLMQLETELRLPSGSNAWLESPSLLSEHFAAKRDVGSICWLPINPFGRTTMPEMLFPASSRAKLRLLVHIPYKNFEVGYRVLVRQLFENREVGRVTWRITPKSGESNS